MRSREDAILADGDLVAIQWTITGTQSGPFLGIAPAGRSLSVSGMDVLRVRGGAFVEHWGGLRDQLDTITDRLSAAP